MTDMLPEKARALIENTFRKAMKEIDAHPALRACASFSQLHDVCDANCLGGACDDDYPLWIDPDYYDPQAGFTDLGAEVTNTWQARVDAELRRRAD